MKKFMFLMFFVLMSVSFAYAAHKASIELTDGSTLDGEVVSFSDGKYTVNSPSLGTLQIEDSKIRNIRSTDPTAGSPQKDITSLDAATVQNGIQELQPAMIGNPDIMRTISGLISNPDFRDLLKDPEIMNAAKSSNIKALMANEKFIRVLNDPAVKEIRQKVKVDQTPSNGKEELGT